MTEQRVAHEEVRVSGEGVMETIRRILHEGNVRRITIKNAEGRALLDLPLTVGIVGTVLSPVWVVVGAAAALASGCRIEVEKLEKVEGPPKPPGPMPVQTPV